MGNLAYRAAGLLAVEQPAWSGEWPVKWKSIRDVDNEAYHVPMAHSALQDLYGRTYCDLHLDNGLSISLGYFGDAPGRRWSVKNDLNVSPKKGLAAATSAKRLNLLRAVSEHDFFVHA